jgi:hypothetical protein
MEQKGRQINVFQLLLSAKGRPNTKRRGGLAGKETDKLFYNIVEGRRR